MQEYITIIGGGLAGCEAAYQIAKRGINVKLYEMKPVKFSPAHTNKDLAEIVCSNSLKSNSITNACGLLKEELRKMDSLLIKCADETAVPAGQALAVDRDKFSALVTKKIEELGECRGDVSISASEQSSPLHKKPGESLSQYSEAYEARKTVPGKFGNIQIIHEELKEIPKDRITIIATGPLTSEELANDIANITGEDKLHFYDAAAPILTKESINFNIAFWGDRYGKGDSNYINLPMDKEEYEKFYNELINAEVVDTKKFEKRDFFEGCMPVEIMAKRGIDTLRFGPLKPVGFTDPRTGNRPYAIVQLRQDNEEGTIFNIVGFQTNLKFGEQKRVFSLIPGLENAEFVRYGVMHRNTFINSPLLLDNTYNLKSNNNIFFAGQITGVEGYVESISSGFIARNKCSKYVFK